MAVNTFISIAAVWSATEISATLTAPTLSVMIALLLETLLAALVVPAIFSIQRNVYNTYPWQFPDIVGRKFPWPAAIKYQLCNSRSRDQQCRLVTECRSLGAWAHRQNMWDGHWPGLFELRGKMSCDFFCAGIFQPLQSKAIFAGRRLSQHITDH